MVKRRMLIVGRVFFALVALFALTVQLAIHIVNGFSVVNFFSYFTNLANIFAAIVLLIAAVHLDEYRPPSRVVDALRGAAVVWMALVGIVYLVLLRHEDLGSLNPWINAIIHYLMPVIVVADWFFDLPKLRVSSKYIRFWLIFPVVYLAYSVLRGAMTGWYAYPFLNPDQAGGYAMVLVYCAGMLIGFLLLGWLLVTASNRPRPPQHTHQTRARIRAKAHGKA